MVVYHTDIDNTLIYSYKHDIGTDVVAAEVREGRGVGFMTGRTHKLLVALAGEALVVPVTTRSLEQYRRICLPSVPVRYALVDNGGILLKDGECVADWREETAALTAPGRPALVEAFDFLTKDERRLAELRFVDDLFLFTKCRNGEDVAADLEHLLDMTQTDIITNGNKIYVLPKELNKGTALKRFQAFLPREITLCAGDSACDIPMLLEADQAFAPHGFCQSHHLPSHIKEAPPNILFSEYALTASLNLIQERKCPLFPAVTHKA